MTKSAEKGGDKTQTQNLHQKSAKLGAFAFWKLQENKERNWEILVRRFLIQPEEPHPT